MGPTRKVTLATTAVAVLLALACGLRSHTRHAKPVAKPAPASATAPATTEAPGLLYGRVTSSSGDVYEGRLRWGSDQEAFWSDAFNGFKKENPWAARVPPGLLPEVDHPLVILGVEIARRRRPIDLGRPFMARFGDLARIEARGRHVLVTLKSGTVFDLDRFDSSDFDDGVRVWDAKRGVVDLDPQRIRTIEFLPTTPLAAPPERLHGTVHTRQGDFTGFLQWNRQACVSTDELDGLGADGRHSSLRFDTLRSITHASARSALMTQLDGREIELTGTSAVGDDNRGVYVDDRRYGRVLISWDAFERVDFSAGDSGPAYGDFPAGRPLTGTVTARDGRRLTGRLVYDLDESESTDTLDAPSRGVNYLIPFGLVASIKTAGSGAGATVILRDGEELQLEPAGDLGAANAGMLIFVEGAARPEYVLWTEVERVEFERP